MDINTVKAGRYQLLVERWDRQTSKPGEPFTFERFGRGDEVDLSESDARRLVACGAAVTPGSIEKAQAQAATQRLKLLLAQVPDDVRAQLIAELGEDTVHAALTGQAPAEPTDQPTAPATVLRPADNDSKGSWVAFAVDQGMTEAAAQALTRNQLVERFPATT